MTIRRVAMLFVCVFTFTTGDAVAQSLGTFRWQLEPFGSVLNLNVTQQGSIFLLNGFEVQCGGNPSLPVYGVAVPQANGTIFMGLTSITDQGNGLHTRITLTLGDFGGGWIDNGNQSGTLRFNPPDPCPLGPRVTPVEPDANRAAPPSAGPNDDMMRALLAELASMRKRLAELEAKQQ